MKIKSYIKRGNSFPVILEDNGIDYFVKLRAGMSGKYALVSEWIGNKIGNQLGIKTQTPIWINIDKEVGLENIYIEVRELIHKSIGLNIGFEYQEDAREFQISDLEKLDRKQVNEIFLFDIIMLNIDRTLTNTNLMWIKDEISSVDYESSLFVQELIENKNLLKDERILLSLKTNPLYQDQAEESINKFIEKLKNISIDKIIAEIPFDLMNQEERNSILKGFEHKQKNRWFLNETMSKLKVIKIETEEERKVRANKNQATFIRNLKNNSTLNNK